MGTTVSVILPGIYLGGADCLKTPFLEQYQIKHVISLCNVVLKSTDERRFFHLPITDSHSLRITTHFEATTRFILQAKSNHENIFIYCDQGISRSPTVVIAYLMLITKLSFDECFQFVRSRRSIVQPNPSFLQQLQSFSLQCPRVYADIQASFPDLDSLSTSELVYFRKPEALPTPPPLPHTFIQIEGKLSLELDAAHPLVRNYSNLVLELPKMFEVSDVEFTRTGCTATFEGEHTHIKLITKLSQLEFPDNVTVNEPPCEDSEMWNAEDAPPLTDNDQEMQLQVPQQPKHPSDDFTFYRNNRSFDGRGRGRGSDDFLMRRSRTHTRGSDDFRNYHRTLSPILRPGPKLSDSSGYLSVPGSTPGRRSTMDDSGGTDFTPSAERSYSHSRTFTTLEPDWGYERRAYDRRYEEVGWEGKRRSSERDREKQKKKIKLDSNLMSDEEMERATPRSKPIIRVKPSLRQRAPPSRQGGVKPKHRFLLYCAHCDIRFRAKPTLRGQKWVLNHQCVGDKRRQYIVGGYHRTCKKSHRGPCVQFVDDDT